MYVVLDDEDDDDDKKHLEFHDDDEQESEKVPKPPKSKKIKRKRKNKKGFSNEEDDDDDDDEDNQNEDGDDDDEKKKSRRKKKKKRRFNHHHHHHRKVNKFNNDENDDGSEDGNSNNEEEEDDEEESPDMSIHMLDKVKEGIGSPQSFNNNDDAPVAEDSGNEMQHQEELNSGIHDEESIASIIKSKQKSKKLFGTALAKMRLGQTGEPSRVNTRFYVTQDGQRYQINMKSIHPSTDVAHGVINTADSFVRGGGQLDFLKTR